MSISGQAYVVGAYEHSTRHAPDKSIALLHAEAAQGALADSGLSKEDVDGYFCGKDAVNTASMVDYLNLKVRHVDGTDAGGVSNIIHVAHAVEAIAAGRCNVALITLAGRPRSEGQKTGTAVRAGDPNQPALPFEYPYRPTIAGDFAMVAARHMHEFGTTSEQLAWIKVAASIHAQYNPNARLPSAVTVEEVVNSPLVAAPLHRLDCCVITDGGGALVIARPEIAKSLSRPRVKIVGIGEAASGQNGGIIDLSRLLAPQRSGADAFAMAGASPADIQYASIYDCFTIAVLMQLEALGFCERGQGGRFVADGNLISGVGKLPFNTDGGGLCNNHPGNRGGMTKMIEAVRQARGEAIPEVQVRDARLVLATGIGGYLSRWLSSATVIMERE